MCVCVEDEDVVCEEEKGRPSRLERPCLGWLPLASYVPESALCTSFHSELPANSTEPLEDVPLMILVLG